MWKVGCFYGTGEELVKKAFADSELSGRCYELIVRAVEEIEKTKAKLGKPEARVWCKHDATRKCVCCEGCPSTEGGAE